MQSAHLNIEAESGHHDENNNTVPINDMSPIDPNGAPIADLADANSQVAININLPTNLENNIRGEPRHRLEKHPKGKVMGLAYG